MVSILLPTHNGEKYISESIDSILNQTFSNFELLIGFNGTTDNSKNIVGSYKDERIRIFDYEDDKGKSKTLNKLLLESRFDYIALQDDDDIWMNTKLEKQIKLVDQFDVIGTFISYIDKNGSVGGSPHLVKGDYEIRNSILRGDNQIANSSSLFSKKSALSVNGWGSGFRPTDWPMDGLEDFEFWIKLLFNGAKFMNITECLVLHRLHSESNFNTKNYDIKKILENAYKFQ
jgi:glycosyltransferase involved in cell wall biosynthesis